MTVTRALLLACLICFAALACGSGSPCPDTSSLDCGNGACCDASHAFLCGARCWVSPSLAAENGCGDAAICKATQATACYADWNCGTNAQCSAAMGGSRGAAGPFVSSAECEAWRGQHAATSKCYCR
jgi:hypothetical protein